MDNFDIIRLSTDDYLKLTAELYPGLLQQNRRLGNVCQYQHRWNETSFGLRAVTHGGCIECVRNRSKRKSQTSEYKEYQQGYQLQYRASGKHSENNKRYRKSEKGKAAYQSPEYKAYMQRYHQSDSYKASRKKYNQSLKGKLADRKNKNLRKSRKRNNHSFSYSSNELLKVKEKFNGECVYCGKPGEEIDHFIAIKNGGPEVLGNLVLACRHCNGSKNDSDVQDWYPRQPFYSKQRWKKILAVLGKTEGTINQLALF